MRRRWRSATSCSSGGYYDGHGRDRGMSRLPVAVVGATGAIGQRFISLLQDHPMFELAVLSASERKVGGSLSDFWRLEGALDPDIGGRELQSLDVKLLDRAGVSARSEER